MAVAAAEKDAVAGAQHRGGHGGEARVLAARSGVELGLGGRRFDPRTRSMYKAQPNTAPSGPNQAG